MNPAHARTATETLAVDIDPVDADRVGRLSVWIYIAWLSTAVFEGPLRGGLSAIGLVNVLYTRDLIVVFGVALALIRPLTHGTSPTPGLTLMAWLVAVHLCVGILLSGSLFRPFFGLKIFLPLLYAVAISPAVNQHFRLFVAAMAVFFVASVAGVFVNDFIGEMPWEGISYETAFGSVQTTKVWWMGQGLRRLPGLARTSVDVAMMIGVSATILMAVARARWVRLLVVVLATWTIVLSTSKGMILAFGLASLWLVPSSRSSRSLQCGRLLAIALLLLTLAVPTVFMIVSVPTNPVEMPLLLESIWDRFSWMWPSGYALLPDYYGAITGAGLGSIGSPLGMLPVPNTGDSIFVYCYVSFGLLALVYLAFPLRAVPRPGDAVEPRDFAWVGVLIIAYGYGLVTNMVEQGFFLSVFGLVYAKAFEMRKIRASPG